MKGKHQPFGNSKHAIKPSARLSKDPDLISIDEATELLHCRRVTLLRLIERDQLHLLKVGGRWMFQNSELEALNNRKIATYPHLTLARQRCRQPRH